MDAKTLQRENKSLKQRLKQVEEQHDAVVSQFVLSLKEKDRKVASLEHRIKLLLQKIRGSRQERIDPDQLMLFSVEELQELADELENKATQEGDQDQDDDEPLRPRKRHGRRQLPQDMQREILRHELTAQELPCPCWNELRCEIGVESSEQLEYIPGRWKVTQHDRVKYACRPPGT